MTTGLHNSLTLSLGLADEERARRVLDRLPDDTLSDWNDEGQAFLCAVFSASPYLGRLALRRHETLKQLASSQPETILEDVYRRLEEPPEEGDEALATQILRQAKADMHLVTAMADLSGHWTLKQTVSAISTFADKAIVSALRTALGLTGCQPVSAENPVPGLTVLALGKLGTQTLNYSSDIDLVVLFDADRMDLPEGTDVQKWATRLTRKWVHLLQTVTPEGYVFRVDLRLRPDPSSTPVAVSVERGHRYFEAVGQNWERAAYAKARYCAGDREVAEAFLKHLEPFIWRRSLDFAAVEDIHTMARQIQAVGDRASFEAAGHDVKLGRGGIREIEFIAQIPQLVFGGRRPEIRISGTVESLQALTEAGLIEHRDAEQLISDYRTLRNIEHRIQMLEDEQTQTLPRDDATRHAVGCLMGETDLDHFDQSVTALLHRVHNVFSAQFTPDLSLASKAGSLVLTGVEPSPDTLETLSTLGFSNPDQVWKKFSAWSAGKAKAARTERARALFSKLAPVLIEAISETGDPDVALSRFGVFFEGLPSGVQLLSLLSNHPELTSELIKMLGMAPKLGQALAQRPALVDIMLDPRFSSPLKEEDLDVLVERIEAGRRDDFPYESVLDQARRVAREERIRIGGQILLERAGVDAAGRAYSNLADACVQTMARAVLEQMEARHGGPPGDWAVAALGKFGSREMSAESDLDLLVLYHPEKDKSDGDRPLGCDTWFSRFTQRLVAALSAPTGEGELYEVDLALRPSGKSGPIAVRHARLIKYYTDEAWTWERMAMTRLRVICGSGTGEPFTNIMETVFRYAQSPDTIRADVRQMRQRLHRDKPARSFWDLKRQAGGLVDIEFLAQAGQLLAGHHLSCQTQEALVGLSEEGLLSSQQRDALIDAWTDITAFQQLTRLGYGTGFDPDEASGPFLQRLAHTGHCESITALKSRLEGHLSRTRQCFEDIFGPMSDPATD